MDNTTIEEEKNTQNCTHNEACRNPATFASAPSTMEEISTALDTLIDMVKRYNGRAIFAAFLEDPEERKTRRLLESSSTAFRSEGTNTKVYGWTGAFGYFLKANECFDCNVNTMGEGVRLFLEQQQKEKMKKRMNPIAAMLGIVGCECEECEG